MTVVLGAESYSAVGVGEPWPDIIESLQALLNMGTVTLIYLNSNHEQELA